MLLAGDELGRTQQGNNNAYCQDNELSWVDWTLDRPRREPGLTRRLIQVFHQHPVLRRRKFFHGRQIRGAAVQDLLWFRPDGQEMSDDDWRDPQAAAWGCGWLATPSRKWMPGGTASSTTRCCCC